MTTTPARFTQWCAATHRHDMSPDESGLWVRYEDIKQLLVYEAIFEKHKVNYRSGCACNITEEDGEERVTSLCDFHRDYIREVREREL